MEADRKAMANQANVPADPQFQSRTTYRVKNKKFIDHLEEILQSYVDRREQVRLIKELYGNQIGELKVTVSIRYSDLLFTLPSQARVLAWPLRSSRGISVTERRASRSASAQLVPFRLPYAEDALKTLSLPEAFAEIVLSLPRALKRILSSQESD
uniref:Uncharacterized protein n=2 Tax=Oryza TaxID=4527 RepID=A0A0E0P6S6_ORYRU